MGVKKEKGGGKLRGRESLGLIFPPQSGAASDSICFKYMDQDPGQWLVGGMEEKKEEEEEKDEDTIPISHDLQDSPPQNETPTLLTLYETTRF